MQMRSKKIIDVDSDLLCFMNEDAIYSLDDDRMVFQEVFGKFLEKIGADHYGYLPGYDNTDNVFENDTFLIRPYYWGDDEQYMGLPHFVYKPANILMVWYKYPLRDTYFNKDISLDEFKKMLNDCIDSLKNTFT